jgi:EAL domain-containing protein (putative c-di-GMP-specific phosphodiesterase class I)/GGDEF domain-containing protein
MHRLAYRKGCNVMIESAHTYHECLPKLVGRLMENGSLALMLLDISSFSAVEERYGYYTYDLVRRRLFDLIAEQSGKEYRREDIVALEEPSGLRILLFLCHGRNQAHVSYESLENMRKRLMSSLVPKLARTAFPYLKIAPSISIGFALGIRNALIDPTHVILRIIREALDHAEWRHRTEEMESLQKLREVILNEKVLTLYQPIVSIADGNPIAYEALSRGIPNSIFASADDLFDAAIHHRLLVELDRVCRKKALERSTHLPDKVKIFINTLPATMHDPEFQGKYLIDILNRARLTPDRIVIEITEKMVIDNLGLFQDTMHYFTDLGMTLAVDDVGAGYSGLETVSKLNPGYLKVDRSLVQNVHASAANREILKGIVMLGRGMGARIIAEGIETNEALETLRETGVEYGQGYLFGRPSAMISENEEPV